MGAMVKYPKTPRLAAILESELSRWRRSTAVVEEKVDGANAAVHFSGDGLVLQSRGHVLSGGPGEAQFDLLKSWVAEHEGTLRERLGMRYVVFGEWCYAKHRVFYDALPAYFLEFDVLDKERGEFLSTRRRRVLLAGGPLVSVAVLHERPFDKVTSFGAFIGPSTYKTDRWRELFEERMRGGFERHYAASETDISRQMEGVYVKVEDDERVIGRMKVLRPGLEKVRMDDAKWLRRPLFPNELARPNDR